MAAMALAAGYAKTYEFDALEEFLIGLEEVMVQQGPIMVVVKVWREEVIPFPERTMAEGWAAVRESLASGG